jgi:hypothetical protein
MKSVAGMKLVDGMKPFDDGFGGGLADAADGIGGGRSCIGALFLNGGSFTPPSGVLGEVPALGSDNVGSGFTSPSASSSLLLSCAIAPSMPDASPVSSIKSTRPNGKFASKSERRTASPQGQPQRPPSEMLIHPSPNAWPLFGAKERFNPFAPRPFLRASRSKVNALVEEAQFTSTYKLCVRLKPPECRAKWGASRRTKCE